MSQQKYDRTEIFNLPELLGKRVRLSLMGGREFVGVLKGYDMLMNVVLDDSIEYIKNPSGGGASLTETRPLGLMITRGISIQVISPEENRVQIENPFQ